MTSRSVELRLKSAKSQVHKCVKMGTDKFKTTVKLFYNELSYDELDYGWSINDVTAIWVMG